MTERLLELARREAERRHDIGCDNDLPTHTDIAFTRCSHPDCVLVRGGSAPAPATCPECINQRVKGHGEGQEHTLAELRPDVLWLLELATERLAMEHRGDDRASECKATSCVKLREVKARLDSLIAGAKERT